MKRNTKNENTQFLEIRVDGGLNYSNSPTNIKENELKRALNWMYDVSSDVLTTRPGTDCVTATALASPIRKLHYYEKNSSTAYLVCASGAKLYYFDGTDAWVEIGSLADSTTVPSFLTFNNTLLIADGGAEIKTWDGTTYTVISGSPQATCLVEIKGRVVANATDEPDSVYLSKPEDFSNWDTTGDALGLKAGFGDMLSVNGFAVHGDNLIVFKMSATSKVKRIYRVDTSDTTPSNWVCTSLSVNNGTQNTNSIVCAFNNVFFVDQNGFKSIKNVVEYGDMQVDETGAKINTALSALTCDEVTFIPYYNSVFIGAGDRTFVYSEKEGVGRFTDLIFNWGRCMSFCQIGNVVYLAGYNGFLYKFDDSLDTDETAPGVTSHYATYMRTKTFSYMGDVLLKKTFLYCIPVKEGTSNVYITDYSGNDTLIKSFTVLSDEMLSDATGYLADATGYLADAGGNPWIEVSRNKVRGKDFAFELRMPTGRVGIEKIQVELVVLEGGE